MFKNTEEFDEMKNLGICVKAYIKEGRYKECENLLAYAMYLHPHAPEPHNLFGSLFPATNDFAYDMEDCIVEKKRRTARMSKV